MILAGLNPFVSSLCILLANGVREFFNVDSDNLCFYTIKLVLCVLLGITGIWQRKGGSYMCNMIQILPTSF